jgi:cbb3-type cytochrome oxidase subunit 3
MKFIHYIEKVSGVDIMGIASLLIFVLFFAGMLTWVLRSNKKKLEEISRLPLDNNS